jgi:Na+/melibiose symporter-like transporter
MQTVKYNLRKNIIMENSIHELPRAKTSKMILFAFPRVGSSLLLGVVGFALLLLYTKGYNLDDAKVTLIMSGGLIAIAASQFFFGWLSDVTYSEKFGGRKPYVFILAPLLGISFIFLLMPGLVLENPSDETLLAWLAVWNTLFQISYAVTTPYQAWMAEQFATQDRVKCSQIQNIFNFIGQASQVIFSMLVLTAFATDLETNPNDVPPLFFWICILFVIIFVGSFYMSAILMPKEARPAEKPNMKQNLKEALTNWNFLKVTLMQGIASVGWIISGTVMLKYLDEVLLLGTMEYIVMAAMLIIGMVVFLAVWRRVIGKNGKKKSILFVFISGILFMPISLVGLIEMSNTIFFAAIFVLGLAGVMGGWYLFPYVIYADLAEDDYRRTKIMKAGLYAGFPSIFLNLFQAFGLFILAQLFLRLGDVTIGANTQPLTMYIWGPVCSIFLVLALLFTFFFVKLDYKWEKAPEMA